MKGKSNVKSRKGEAKSKARGVKVKRETRIAPGKETPRLSGLSAAAKVLKEAREPLNCKTIVERALERGYWKTKGKTPESTIYSAILREIRKKGDAARFRKAERGEFTLA